MHIVWAKTETYIHTPHCVLTHFLFVLQTKGVIHQFVVFTHSILMLNNVCIPLTVVFAHILTRVYTLHWDTQVSMVLIGIIIAVLTLAYHWLVLVHLFSWCICLESHPFVVLTHIWLLCGWKSHVALEITDSRTTWSQDHAQGLWDTRDLSSWP